MNKIKLPVPDVNFLPPMIHPGFEQWLYNLAQKQEFHVTPYELLSSIKLFYQYFPQINAKTRLEFTNEREMYSRVIGEMRYRREPRAGLIAALQRLRGRIHLWFLKHSVHPGDVPSYNANDARQWGMTDSVFIPTVDRKLEMRRFGLQLTDTRNYGGGEHYPAMYLSFACAYDPTTDTLYLGE